MARPLFQLSPRLALCAQLVREGAALCDVGTDHAYLPIWLLKSGKISRALAADINEGPLAAAKGNAEKYGEAERLTLRLSDGLRNIRPEEADDIVIAGMGGELILRLVGETPWLRDGDRRLVLQPMSSAEELRRGLRKLGFDILEEQAVLDGGRPYTAFSAAFRESGRNAEEDLLFPYLGKLSPGTRAAEEYAGKVRRDLLGRLEGALRGRGGEDPETLRQVIRELEARYEIG